MATGPNQPPKYEPSISSPGGKGTSTPGPNGRDPSKEANWERYKQLGFKIVRGGGLAALSDAEQLEWAVAEQAFRVAAPSQLPRVAQSDPTAAGAKAPPPVGKPAPQPDLFESHILGSQNTSKSSGQQSATGTSRDNDLLDEALGEPSSSSGTRTGTPPETTAPTDPLRDFGGPNDPAAGQRGDNGKPVDVNIVGSIPLPVFMTQGGQPGADVAERDSTDTPEHPQGHDAYGNPVDNEHALLAGMTIQESFNKFAGGYAAGYPIHNLKQLGKNLFGIGKSAVRGVAGKFGRKKRKKDEDDTQRAGWFGSKRGGKAAKPTAVPDNYGRKTIKPLGPAKVTGVGKVRTAAASGLMGEAASVGRLAAIGGAAGTAVAGIGLFVAAVVKASQEVYSFARAQEEEVRRLADLNASLAVATATLDMGRLERDIEMGRATEESGATLTDSIDRFERAIAPIQEVATNIANTVGGTLLDVVTSLATVVSEAIHWWRGTTAAPAAERMDTAWDVFIRLAADRTAGGRRDWPGASGGRP